MNEELNIPIYRAKKKPIYDNNWVAGFLENHATKDKPLYRIDDGYCAYDIDPSTLAIHFPDMIDSEGTKIFTNLSANGRGGDNITISGIKYYTNMHMNIPSFVDKYTERRSVTVWGIYSKVTGIQE